MVQKTRKCNNNQCACVDSRIQPCMFNIHMKIKFGLKVILFQEAFNFIK